MREEAIDDNGVDEDDDEGDASREGESEGDGYSFINGKGVV